MNIENRMRAQKRYKVLAGAGSAQGIAREPRANELVVIEI